MKKIATLFFLLIFLIILSIENNESTILVSKVEDNTYEKLYLKFDDDLLTTKNFKIYFNNDIKLISFYTSNDCVNNQRYLFRFNDINSNLNGYIDFYNKLYMFDTSNYFNGTPIGIAEVIIDNDNIEKILSKNINVKYSKEVCENYHR